MAAKSCVMWLMCPSERYSKVSAADLTFENVEKRGNCFASTYSWALSLERKLWERWTHQSKVKNIVLAFVMLVIYWTYPEVASLTWENKDYLCILWTRANLHRHYPTNLKIMTVLAKHKGSFCVFFIPVLENKMEFL